MNNLRTVRLFVVLTMAGILNSELSVVANAIEIGQQVEELNFKDIRYLPRTLADFGEKKAYVLFFTNTDCPLVQRYMPVLMRLDETYGPEGVQFIAVNVGRDDSIKDMASHALQYGALFPFVKDVDGSVTRNLGVQRTPEVAVLDSKMKLVYRGRINSQYRLGGVSPNAGRADLEEAIKEVISGQTVSVAETPVDGCKITLAQLPASSEPITYTQHVAHVMKKHCQTCHRENTAAPFGLGTFEDVSAHGEMVAEVVMEERMPPWYAHTEHGKFKNDRSLTRAERIQVAQWVSTGMAEGDPKFLPEPFQAPETKWEIGEPDLVITMSKALQDSGGRLCPVRICGTALRVLAGYMGRGFRDQTRQPQRRASLQHGLWNHRRQIWWLRDLHHRIRSGWTGNGFGSDRTRSCV